MDSSNFNRKSSSFNPQAINRAFSADEPVTVLPTQSMRQENPPEAITVQNDHRQSNVSFSNAGKKRVTQIRFSDNDDTENVVKKKITLGAGGQHFIVSKLEKVEGRNFRREVRAQLDVDKFMKDAVILLNLECDKLEDVMHEMASKCIGVSLFKQPFKEDDHENQNGRTFNLGFKLRRRSQSLNLDGDHHGFHMEEEHDPTNAGHIVEDAMKALFVKHCYEDISYLRLSKTLQGICATDDGSSLMLEPTWICVMCSLPCANKSYIAIARLKRPLNMGVSCEDVRLIAMVISPEKEKSTKSDLELARTLATILAGQELRRSLLSCPDVGTFKICMKQEAHRLNETYYLHRKDSNVLMQELMSREFDVERRWPVFNGIYKDVRGRLRYYISDYIDIFRDWASIRKLITTTIFLYFACLLVSIALGVLHEHNTNSKFGVRRTLIGQTIGGVIFALIGGQPLVVLMTTAPLALYIKAIYKIAGTLNVDFLVFYFYIGLFNSFLLAIYSIFDLSRYMKWCTRSIEEIFALFISFTFCFEVVKDMLKNLGTYYCEKTTNGTLLEELTTKKCDRAEFVLSLLLLIGTVWIGVSLLNFTTTPYLNQAKRQLLAGLALPISILVMSFVGSYLFREIDMDPFLATPKIDLIPNGNDLLSISWTALLACFGIAAPLSLLFFLEQNLTQAIVNAHSNKLKKGTAYHWDILIVALVNVILSVFGLPWVHGAVPHSPLHTKALADVEERVKNNNQVTQCTVRSRETRITNLLCNTLVGISILMLEIPLKWIPVAVLNGLFIYMAITTLFENQLFERILLLVTEQSAYPPSHYIRRVPQRKMHIFTIIQVLQLVALCVVGFVDTPYAKLCFPILLLLQLPIRHWLIPKLVEKQYLDALDRAF